MENKYLVPFVIATIAIITGGVLLTQQLGIDTSLQTTVINEQGVEVESKVIKDTNTGEKYTVTDEAGGYPYTIEKGGLVIDPDSGPVKVPEIGEDGEPTGKEILSCGQKSFT